MYIICPMTMADIYQTSKNTPDSYEGIQPGIGCMRLKTTRGYIGSKAHRDLREVTKGLKQIENMDQG